MLGPFIDASGARISLPAPPRRIVSLIPSITEILFALGLGESVAGCTIYCTQPPDGVAGKTRVGGEKNPKLELIRELGADLVVANIEENLREHVETLRGWGMSVYVTYPRTVADGIRLIRDLGAVTGTEARAGALAEPLERRYAEVRARLAGRPLRRVFCPIWRNPYMTINRDTYVHDVLAVCGGENVFGARPARYPEVTLEEVAAARPEVILLPDEPYRFRQVHLADFIPHADIPAIQAGRVHLVDGKLLTWYGPRIGEALETLPPLLAD
ncbi:MAG TPA: cobalamin-binding protein [Methylomirabilota bacterium]|nr:cobalamin-binding protein [Methylomirabilota bacterium]